MPHILNKSILLIEDDDQVRLTLKWLVEESGYMIKVAKDILTAENILKEEEVGLIISDASVLDRRPKEWIERNNTPVLLISGSLEQIKAKTGSATPFLAKPFRISELVRMIDQIISK